MEQSFEALAHGRAAPHDPAPTAPGEPGSCAASFPAVAFLDCSPLCQRKPQQLILLLPGDKWSQAKSDAKEGGQKLADAASEAADAATMKARHAGDRAAGKADELGVSDPLRCWVPWCRESQTMVRHKSCSAGVHNMQLVATAIVGSLRSVLREVVLAQLFLRSP